MYDVIVANGRYLGGGMKIAPDAEPDDGLFDVLLIGDVTKLDLVATMPKIYRGTHLPHPKAELLRGAIGHASTRTQPLPIQLDGEQPGRRRCASTSFRGRSACGCPPSSLRGLAAASPAVPGLRAAASAR